jgi:hypothetical protein
VLIVGDQGFNAAAAKGACHAEQVYRLQYAGFSTAITSEKDVHSRKILQPYLAQVPDIAYL